MAADMTEQGMGSSGDNYIFYLQMMMNGNTYMQLRYGLCTVQSVRGILGLRVVRLLTTTLQKDK